MGDGGSSLTGDARTTVPFVLTALHVAPETIGKLLYVSDAGSKVDAYSYPRGKLVVKLTFSNLPTGLCVDAASDVFVVTQNGRLNPSTIYEYAHGGTTPIATLTDPGEGQACSVDASSGDLAVANPWDASNPSGPESDVAIFRGARGTPKVYSSSSMLEFLACSYDEHGNLFAAGVAVSSIGFGLAEIPSEGNSFETVSINEQLLGTGVNIQWYHNYLALTAPSNNGNGPTNIYHLAISGTEAIVTGKTVLTSRSTKTKIMSPYSWIFGKKVTVPIAEGAGIWKYPASGQLRSKVKAGFSGWAVTVSP